MIDFLQNIDAQMLMAVNSLHAPVMDRFMTLFTGKWIWVPLYASIAWYLIKTMGWRNGMGCILAIIIAVTMADQTCATVVRPLAERLRPAHPLNPLSTTIHIVDGYRGGAYGFPSCHAANTFALAGYFLFLGRKTPVTPLLLVWALANCYTRLYLGVHYPGDLIAGACVGFAAAGLCFWLSKRILKFGRLYGPRHVLPVLAVAALSLTVILSISLFAG